MQYKLSKNVLFNIESEQLIFEKKDKVKLEYLELMVLNTLIQKNGTVVSKEELLSLWPSKVVMEHSLLRVISSLRKKLCDNTESPKYIKTIKRKGYQFIAEVEQYNEKKPMHTYLLFKGWRQVTLPFLALLIMLLFIGGVNTKEYVKSKPNQSLKELNALQVDDSSLSVNGSGEYLLFHVTDFDNSMSFLRVKSLLTDEFYDYKLENNQVHSAAWLDNVNIIFIAQNSTTCLIKTVTLTDNRLSEEKTLSNCFT